MSHAAFRLYVYYKSVAGEDSRCYQSSKTISKNCKMSPASVIGARRELEGRKLIKVTQTGKMKDGSLRTNVVIIDIWKDNQEWNQGSKIQGDGVLDSGGAPIKSKGGAPIRSGGDNKNPKDKKKRGGRRTSPPPPTGFLSTDFDVKAAGYLREVLALYDSDLVSSPKVVKVQTLAKSIFRLRTERDSATEPEIKAMIKWLKVAYGSIHVPKMRKADDLFTNWGRYREAKRGWEDDRAREGEGCDMHVHIGDDDPALVLKVRDWLEKHLGIVNQSADQSEVDQALEALGHPAGTISDREF